MLTNWVALKRSPDNCPETVDYPKCVRNLFVLSTFLPCRYTLQGLWYDNTFYSPLPVSSAFASGLYLFYLYSAAMLSNGGCGCPDASEELFRLQVLHFPSLRWPSVIFVVPVFVVTKQAGIVTRQDKAWGIRFIKLFTDKFDTPIREWSLLIVSGYNTWHFGTMTKGRPLLGLRLGGTVWGTLQSCALLQVYQQLQNKKKTDSTFLHAYLENKRFVRSQGECEKYRNVSMDDRSEWTRRMINMPVSYANFRDCNHFYKPEQPHRLLQNLRVVQQTL